MAVWSQPASVRLLAEGETEFPMELIVGLAALGIAIVGAVVLSR